MSKANSSELGASHLCSPPLEIGALRQEAGGRRQKERRRRKEPEEGRSQKKYFYKYEMLPANFHFLSTFSILAGSPTPYL
ncbi:hypothetical protein QUB12_18535 [Microcoleus sp. B7-D4]